MSQAPEEKSRLLPADTKPSAKQTAPFEISNDLHIVSNNNNDCCTRFLATGYVRVFAAIGLAVCIIIFLAVFPYGFRSQYKTAHLADGQYFYFASPEHELYVRKDATSALVLSESIPWMHGSAFQVLAVNKECFRLKSMTGLWLRVDNPSGDVLVDATHEDDASYFTAIAHKGTDNAHGEKFVNGADTLYIGLKVCSRDEWISVVLIDKEEEEEDSEVKYKLALSSESHENNHYYGSDSASDSLTGATSVMGLFQSMVDRFVKVISSADTSKYTARATARAGSSTHRLRNVEQSAQQQQQQQADYLAVSESKDKTGLTMRLDGSVFRVEQVPHIEGVNLGGWFIPESWMNEGFYNGTGLGRWGGSLCGIVDVNRSLAEERIAEHLHSWLHEDDFKEIHKFGFNSVRLPIGYWNVIEDPYNLFAPADVSLSLKYIDWAFDMADKYELSVLLDLHGAPGSQNGIDHSGCGNAPANWLESKDNQQMTLDALEAMIARYGKRKSLLGLELVNEPSLFYSKEMHPQVTSFYKKAYSLIRTYHESCLIVFNELYEKCYKSWQPELQEPDFFNVVMDVHLYDWQEPYTSESKKRHIQDAENFAAVIEKLTPYHPVVVGEWSFSTGTKVQALQPFVDACVESFSRASGWYIWNWKIEKDVGFDEWDVQLQHKLKGGMTAVPDATDL